MAMQDATKRLVTGALLALGLALAGCSTVSFYSPEVGPTWASNPLKTEWLGASSVLGVSLRPADETFSVGKHVGGLFDAAYVVDHSQTWTLLGPGGYQGRLEVVQTGIRFQGTLDHERLKVNSSDWSSVKYQVKITDPRGTRSTEPAPWRSGYDAALTLGTVALTPYYVGKGDDGVTDYQAKGLVTGYQIHDGDRFVGYLDVTKSQLLLAASDPAPDPLVVGLALWAAQGRPFVANPASLAVETLSLDLSSGKLMFSH
jgi:hypothetical protein